jgi:hypothetical protein
MQALAHYERAASLCKEQMDVHRESRALCAIAKTQVGSIFMNIYTHTRTHAHTHTHIHTYIHTCILTYIHTCIHMYTNLCVCVCVCLCVCVCVCVCAAALHVGHRLICACKELASAYVRMRQHTSACVSIQHADRPALFAKRTARQC